MTVDGKTVDLSPARVLAARVLPPPSRPDAVARPAARPGLAVQRRGDAQRGRRLHPLPAREARRGRPPHRDRPRRRLSDGRCLTARPRRPSRPPANAPPTSPTPALVRRVRRTSCCGAAGRPWSSCSSSRVALYVAVAGSLAAAASTSSRTRWPCRAPVLTGSGPTRATTSPYGLQLRLRHVRHRPRRRRPAVAGPRLPDAGRAARQRRRRGRRARAASDVRTDDGRPNDVPVRDPDRDRRAPAGQQVVTSRSSRTARPSYRRSSRCSSSCSSAGSSSCWSPSASGPSTPAARSCRSASRSPTSGRRCAASASSPPTRATSSGRR